MSTVEATPPSHSCIGIDKADDSAGHAYDFDDDDIAGFAEQTRGELAVNYRIHHHYDIGNQDIYVQRITGSIDGKRAALYCEFQCEAWFGNDSMLSNLAVGALLCMFYGFRHMAVADSILEAATEIDMFHDHQRMAGTDYLELLADTTLHRPGMQDVMAMLFSRT